MSTNSEPRPPQPSRAAAETTVHFNPAANILPDSRKHTRMVIQACGALGSGKGVVAKIQVCRVLEAMASAPRDLDPFRRLPASGHLRAPHVLESLLPGLRVTDIGDHASFAALLDGISA